MIYDLCMFKKKFEKNMQNPSHFENFHFLLSKTFSLPLGFYNAKLCTKTHSRRMKMRNE